MIKFLTNISLALLPFQKLFYLLAIVMIGSTLYQLAFSAVPSLSQSNALMLSLLALAWLALLNLMIQVFSRIPVALQNKKSLLLRVKHAFHRGIHYVLLLIFVAISIAVLLLTFKMLKL